MSERPAVPSSILRVAAGVAVLLLALAALAWLAWPAPQAREFPLPSASQLPLYGVNLAWEQYDEAGLDAALAGIEALRPGGWVRLRFDWGALEPAPGKYYWDRADRLAAALRRRDLHVIAVVEKSPSWARAENDKTELYAPPLEKRRYGLFLEAFIGRYGDLIDAYQMWDEPNIYPHWGNRHVDAGGYVALLREGAIQVRAGDPGAVVLAGGLAPTTEAGGLNQNDVDYLRAMYAAGAAQWFDALAAKPYGLRSGPDAAPAADQLNFQRMILLRSVMERAGDGTKRIWGVEFGWNSLPADWAGQPSIWGETQDEAQQVAWSAEAIELARREWPWMGPLLWAEWQPAAEPQDARWGFAMLDQQGQPRAIARLFQELPAGRTLAAVGQHGFWEPSVTLEGNWRIADVGADILSDGSAMTIRFEGTAIDLVVRRGAYWAYLDVSIDGQPANALPRDETGRSYLVLHDPELAEATVTLARRLPPGEHAARLTAHGGWDQWALKSFTVRNEPARPAHTRGLIAAGLVAAGALGYLIWLGRRGQIRPALGQVGRFLRRLTLWWQGRPMSLRLAALFVAGGCFILTPAGPWSFLNLIGFIAMACLLCLWPAGGLVLLAAFIPFYVRPPSLLGVKVPGVEMIVWLTAIGWLIESRLRGRSVGQAFRRLWLTRSWLDLSALALLLVAALSTLTAQDVILAADEWRSVFFGSFLLYVLWRIMPASGDEYAWMWWAVDALVAGGVLIALIGLGQRVFSVGLITAEGVTRVRALYGSPNNLALYLERILPICLAVAAFGGHPVRRRCIYGAAAAPITLALYLTFSRGAWFVGLPAMLLVLGLARGGRWRWAALGLVAAALLAMIPLAGTERLSSAFDSSEGTGLVRLRLWQGAWNMARDHPWLGVGPDNFLQAYRTRYVLPSAWEDLNLSHPHNFVLDALTRLGVLGLAAFLALIASLSVRLYHLIRRAPPRAGGELFIGLAGSLAATLAHGLVDNSFFLFDLALVFMMMAGLAARWGAAQGETSGKNETSEVSKTSEV